MTSPLFRQMRRTIYVLKKTYGQEMTICRATNHTLNVETGIQTSSLTSCVIRKAILLPMKSMRSFAYDLSFIAANKNFTYGGFFDINSRVAIFSRRDLPSTFVLDQNAYVKIKGKRYEIKVPTEYEDNEIVYVMVAGLANQISLDSIDINVSQSTNITQNTDGENIGP